jgi:hypothetical protein
VIVKSPAAATKASSERKTPSNMCAYSADSASRDPETAG